MMLIRSNPRPAIRPAFWQRALLMLACLFVAGVARLDAAEVHSNGVGGGNWSSPSTWKARAVPAADDLVVIARGDIVAFDRDDTGKITCAQLSIDAKGGLEFKANGTVVMAVGGRIESYGAIRIDASKLPRATDRMELRFVGKDYASRNLKLLKGSSLQVRGKTDEKGEKTASIVSLPGNAPPPGPNVNDIQSAHSLIEAVAGVMLDMNNTRLSDVAVHATGINNTGSKSTERFNITDCVFASSSRVFLTSCDTPTIVKCTFGDPQKPLKMLPMTLNSSALCEISENKFYGYMLGINGLALVEPSFTDNLFEGCDAALTVTSSSGSMLKRNTIRGGNVGLTVNAGSAVVEDTVIDGVKMGLSLEGASSIQATNLAVKNIPEGGFAATLVSAAAELKLLNASVAPAQIKNGAPKSNKAIVTSNYFVVVKVPGKIGGPKGKPAVHVVRENINPPLKEGAQDMMVRNTPGGLYDNECSALPGTLSAITVRGWQLLADGTVTPAPEYHVEVGKIVREGAKGEEEEVFKQVTRGPKFRPDEKFYRAKPDADPPTLTVNP